LRIPELEVEVAPVALCLTSGEYLPAIVETGVRITTAVSMCGFGHGLTSRMITAMWVRGAVPGAGAEVWSAVTTPKTLASGLEAAVRRILIPAINAHV
jgi:hypothetical protein